MEIQTDTYRQEARELLADLESSLIELEESPSDSDLVGRIFRAMHTIKGSGAMYGFEDIASFSHEVETALDLVRSGVLTVDKPLIDLTLAACDQIRCMLDGEGVAQEKTEEITCAFCEITEGARGGFEQKAAPEEPEEPDGEISGEGAIYRIRFSPHPGLFASGTNPLLLLDELREMGTCRVFARKGDVPGLRDLKVEECRLSWDILLGTDKGVQAIQDVFIFVEDDCDLRIDLLAESEDWESESQSKRLGEILLERGDVTAGELQNALSEQRRLGEILVSSSTVDPDAVASALAEQETIKEAGRRREETAKASSIRVAAEKLDTLVDLVGELVTVQASLTQKSGLQEDPELMGIAEEVERLTGELRDNTMSIRMVPIGTTFSKFKRLVRDLSSELGKEVALTTEGGDTELDKTVIERLSDPLVHIIRNSIDHGIEAPSTREASGKPRKGGVHLSAVHSGAHVLIRISDDGKGLDPEGIRKRAVERGMIEPDAAVSRDDLFPLIFAAGFSTAATVTDVSGRGVGMDVVKRSIEELRGAIEIQSEPEEGTTITLKLPLTLAIIDGLLTEVGEGSFVLPLSVVEECVELNRSEAEKSQGGHFIHVRGEIVPYVPLRSLFNIDTEPPDIEQVVIAEVEGNRVGFVVDQVVGQHQTVIKNLGKVYRDAREFSGATILADGTVALILDTHKLVQGVETSSLRLH